jgi:hypothetical protein
MPTSAEDCTCEKQCPNADECICLYLLDVQRCIVDCTDVTTIPPIEVVSRDARINLSSRGVPRARLGEFLAQVCGDEILIPASVASERVELALYDTAMGEALRQAGLVVRERDGDAAP